MEWFIYLLKVSTCLGIFYGFYHFFLRKLTFFSVNRIYLLGTLVISLVIPAFEFQVRSTDYQPESKMETATLYDGTSTPALSVSNSSEHTAPKVSEAQTAWDWRNITIWAYWIIVSGILLVFVSQIFRVLRYARHVDQKMGKLKIIYKAEGFTNCSFLNYVFVDKAHLSEDEITQIIKHESIHVMCAHTADKLIISLFKALFWFNPIIYFYDYAMEQVHEYEADKKTSLTVDTASYANLLLTIAVKKNNPVLVHSFVKHSLKERLQMLFAKESGNIKKFSYIAVIPIGVALICVFGIQVVYARMPEISLLKSVDVTPEEEVDFKPAKALNELKKARTLINQSEPTDSLLMYDEYAIDKVKELTIDGKPFESGMLYRISPRCIDISKTYFREGKLTLSTRNNEIIYANEIDRYNKRMQNKAEAKERFYVRYTQKAQDGSKYDWITIRWDGKSRGGGGVGLKRGGELLLFIDGKQYHESVLKTIENDEREKSGWNSISLSSGIVSNPLIAARYGKKYSAMIEIGKASPPLPLSYSAADSTVVVTDNGHKIVHLYGKATLTFERKRITGDNMVLNFKTMTGVSKVATVTSLHGLFPRTDTMDSVHFSLKDGSMKSFGYKK